MSRFTSSGQSNKGSRFTGSSKASSTTTTKTTSSKSNTPEAQNRDLLTTAKSVGLEKEADKILNKKPKLSILGRLGAGLGSFETGNAVATAIEKKVSHKGSSSTVKIFSKELVRRSLEKT